MFKALLFIDIRCLWLLQPAVGVFVIFSGDSKQIECIFNDVIWLISSFSSKKSVNFLV